MKKNSFGKHFAKGFRGINKLICHLPIEQKDFVTSLKFDLAHTAKKLFPNKSNAELSKITGISRGTLADYLDQDTPESIVSKDAVLLNHLWMNKDKNNSIPLKGKVSFYSIAKVILNSSYSPSSALDSLIKLNAVKLSDLDQDNPIVIIIQNHLDIAIEEKYGLFINQIGRIIDKFCDTAISNMHNNDKSYQQTYFSTQIPITSQNKVHLELKSLASKTLMPLIRECIDQYEEDVPSGTYPELGFSMFEYRDHIKSK